MNLFKQHMKENIFVARMQRQRNTGSLCAITNNSPVFRCATYGLHWISYLIFALIFMSLIFPKVSFAADINKSSSGKAEIMQVEAKRKTNNQIIFQLQLNKAITQQQIKSFLTRDPDKLVIDLKNTGSMLSKKVQRFDLGVLDSLSIVPVRTLTRLVLDLNAKVEYQVDLSKDGKSLSVLLKQPNQVKKAKQALTSTVAKGQMHRITGIDFRRGRAGAGRIIVDVSDANVGMNIKQQGKYLVVDFSHTLIPEVLQRKLEVTDFGTPVQLIATRSKGQDVQMQIEVKGSYQHMTYQVNNKFYIDISPPNLNKKKQQAREQRYKGKRLSLNFQNIAVRQVLQLIAEFSSLNVVASDTVKGNITLRLNNVPWDQALDIIMKSQGLDKRRYGNVLMIAPATEIAAREKQELTSENEIANLEPLQTEVVALRFAKSEDIANLLKQKGSSFLSDRGNVSIDKRTNSLLIQDTATRLSDVRNLINELDVPVKQVLIEARIVNVQNNFQRELGVRFGLTRSRGLSGTLEGANTLRGAPTAPADVALANRLNFDFQAQDINNTRRAAVGLALATLGGGYMLDLELSALESEGVTHIISTPRVMTSNQNEAYFETGEEIPYQQTSSSGATSIAFRKAVLSVGVTPHITPDNKIIMNLHVTQDKRGTSVGTGLPPAIDTNEVRTRVLVDNGQTVVLGGFYEQDKKNNVERVPFFGSLPIIGALFRHKAIQNQRTELLIFITPRIVDENMRV